jgi:hypothetical protein
MNAPRPGVTVERVFDMLSVNVTRRQTRTFTISEAEALRLAAQLIAEVIGEPPDLVTTLLTSGAATPERDR